MDVVTKKYSNPDITVVWKPALCIHSKLCWTGLRSVFDPRRRPWIDMTAGETAVIKGQVDKCPSGALSYMLNIQKEAAEMEESMMETAVEILPDGPLMIYGHLMIRHRDGVIEEKHKVTAFCRCGASRNKPYCDGSHVKIGFNDKEETIG